MEPKLEELRESYLQSLSQFLNRDQYERACKDLRGLSEKDFIQFWSEMLANTKDYSKASMKERFMAVKKIKEKTSPNEVSASMFLPIEFYDEDKNDYFLNLINSHYVQDYIHLTGAEDRFLIDLWEGKQNWDIDVEKGETRGIVYIPSDLFFAKTIPLKDCVIEIDETALFQNGKVCKARIIVFDDYEKLVEAAEREQSEDAFNVAIFIAYQDDEPIWFKVFAVCRGVDNLVAHTCFGKFPNVVFYREDMRYALEQLSISFLETWYGIQIALLHPDVKDVFKNPQRFIENKSSDKVQKKKRRVVRYIRKHYITLTELETYANTKEAEKKYKRKCLVWHVIGHWRTYKNGTKVFIKPYWKGVLRKVKTLCNYLIP